MTRTAHHNKVGKLLFSIFAILSCLLLTACGSTAELEDTGGATTSQSSIEETISNTDESSIDTIPLETVSVTEEDSIIYSKDGIEVTYVKTKGIKYFKYEVSNTGNCDIQFSVDAVAVNGCMVSDLMAMGVVTSGNKAVEEFDLSGSKDYGIEEVETLDMYIVFYERDTYKTIDKVICHIDVEPTQKFTYTCDLPVFYEDEYLSAYVEQDGDEYEDFEVVYYNKSDIVMSTALSEVSINGVMLSYNIKGAYILPGCYAYTGSSNGTTTLWDAVEGEIKEKGLEQIEKIEGKIAIWCDVFNFGYQTTDNLLIYES